MEKRIKNLMRLFLDSIRDYEGESGDAVRFDERDSEEFVQIFLDSEDAFDYREILKLNNNRIDAELRSGHWKKYSTMHGSHRS